MKGLNAYRRTAVTTSDPMDILVALYDGFLRHCARAQVAMTEGQRAEAGQLLSKAIAIISELQASLDNRHAPEFADRLSALYSFIMQQLLAANVQRDPAMLDDVMRIMRDLRDAWAEAAIQVRSSPPNAPQG